MLSEVPEGWQLSSLGQVARIETGKTPSTKQEEFWGGNIPFVTPSDLDGSLFVKNTDRSLTTAGAEKSKLISAGSLVFTCIASIGKAAINEIDCVTNQQINACTFDSPEETLFYHYQLQHRLNDLMALAGQTAVAIINKGKFSAFDVVVPPLNEQHRIAEILSSVDASIQATQAVIEQAERVKRGLMEELLTGGLSSEAIERGEVPEGWYKTELGSLFVVKSSKRVLQRQWRKEGIPFYRGREITALSEEGFVNNELFIEQELYEEFSSKHGVPKAGDTLITAIGTIGNTYLVREDDRFYFKDASVLWLECASDNLSAFVDYWLKSNLFFSQLDVGNGTTVDSLTISKMKSLSMVLPSVDEQKRVAGMLSDVDVLISKQKEIVKQQNRTKRGLMDDLLTGKVRTV